MGVSETQIKVTRNLIHNLLSGRKSPSCCFANSKHHRQRADYRITLGYLSIFYANRVSILLEELVDLMSTTGILHQSVVDEVVDEFVKDQGFDGKVMGSYRHGQKQRLNKRNFIPI